MQDFEGAYNSQTAFLPLTAVCLPSSIPRSALLLTVFEGLSLEEAAALLGSDRDSVLQGRMAGLWDLTHHLARMQGWNPNVVPLPPASFESEASSLWSES